LAVIEASAAPAVAARATGGAGQSQPRVIMYTTSWCSDCSVAKRYLDQLGVDYEEVDIEDTPGAAELIEQWSGGYRTVPTFDVGGRIVIDFNREALQRALVQA
jgi:glutaredoxin